MYPGSGGDKSNLTRKPKARKATGGKPPKPYADFSLSPHASGAWQKKIKGRLFYFGWWGRQVNGKLERLPGDDWWKPALELYQAPREDIYAGRSPRKQGSQGDVTLERLCNEFLWAKQRKLEAGEITQQTFFRHRAITGLIIGQLGKEQAVDELVADDFAHLRARMAKRWGPVRLPDCRPQYPTEKTIVPMHPQSGDWDTRRGVARPWRIVGYGMGIGLILVMIAVMGSVR